MLCKSRPNDHDMKFRWSNAAKQAGSFRRSRTLTLLSSVFHPRAAAGRWSFVIFRQIWSKPRQIISLQENKLRISLTEESIGIERRGANSKTADSDNSNNNDDNNNNNNKRTHYINADEKNNNSAPNTRKTFSKEMEEDVEVLIKLKAVNSFTNPIIVATFRLSPAQVSCVLAFG